MTNKGGIVLDTGGAFRFLPASAAASVVPAESVVPVPGLVFPAIGLVLTEDRVATVLRVGSHAAEHMIVCEVDGGWVALEGAKVVATGVFPAVADDRNDVMWGTAIASHLDVRALTLEVEEAIWRAAGIDLDERQR